MRDRRRDSVSREVAEVAEVAEVPAGCLDESVAEARREAPACTPDS